MMLEDGIKGDVGVLLAELRIIVIVERAEHGIIPHIMTADGHIVRGGEHIGGGVGVNTAVVVALTVKIPEEVVAAPVGGVHYRVVHLRAFNADPASHIRVHLE